jgi:outer membrane protein OmpA-like peptidoglycan-associated protein
VLFTRAVQRGCLIAAIAGLAACASSHPPQTVVLVPDNDGKVGTVIVSNVGGGGSTTLNKPYAAARVETVGGKSEPRTVSEAEVRKVFGSAIAAQPIRPISFQLYFMEGTDEYTPESKEAFENVFAEVSRRKAAEVAVIGHTDTVGTLEFNDALSLKRAARVRNDFTDRGIPTDSISTAGRGEREPVVPTADDVSEPRNRRVEISVR